MTDAVVARRRVVALAAVVGAAQLGLSLASEPDSGRFYGLTGGVAATWLAAGAAVGERPRSEAGRSPVPPIMVGVVAFAVFFAGALVARRIPVLARALAGVLGYAHHGRTPLVLATTVLNAVAEEVFFRGAVFDVAGAKPIVASTAVYTMVTGATRNPALVLASTVMGALFAWQRRITGGVRASMLTHVTWSTLIVLALPRLFPPDTARRSAR